MGNGLIALDWRGKRPSVQGTLDFEKLDLSGDFSEWLHGADLEKMSGFEIPVAEMAAADIDVQLSVRQVRIGAARIGRTAASFLIRGGNMALEIGEAVLYGGRITARLATTTEHSGDQDDSPAKTVSVTSDLTAHDIDLSTLPLDAWKTRPIAGTAQGSLNLSASGLTVGDLAASAKGRVTASADTAASEELSRRRTYDDGAARRSSRWRQISRRLVVIEAVTTPTVTSPTKIVHTALISGVTPRRTCE